MDTDEQRIVDTEFLERLIYRYSRERNQLSPRFTTGKGGGGGSIGRSRNWDAGWGVWQAYYSLDRQLTLRDANSKQTPYISIDDRSESQAGGCTVPLFILAVVVSICFWYFQVSTSVWYVFIGSLTIILLVRGAYWLGQHGALARTRQKLAFYEEDTTKNKQVYMVAGQEPPRGGSQTNKSGFQQISSHLAVPFTRQVRGASSAPMQLEPTDEDLRQRLKDLETVLAEIKQELLKVKEEAKAAPDRIISVNTVKVENCDHLHALVQTHTRVIRQLELQEAAQGTEFHYSKRIELDERRKRADELRQQITANCPG